MDSKIINNINILPAVSENADEITALVNSVYRGENSKKGWTTEAYFLNGIRITSEKIKEIVKSINNVILIIKYENKIIGCVHLEKENDACWLGMLSVDVNYQVNGLGKFIISKSEAYAREVFNCNEMKMKVISIRKELLDYYLRRGYSLTGESEYFSKTKDTFGIPAASNLMFITLNKYI
jgi:hypothetical protein